MTVDTIIGRIRSLCIRPPFGFVEAVSTEGFVLTPTRDATVFAVRARGGPVRSWMGFAEERTDLIDISVLRAIDADYWGCRSILGGVVTSVSAAVIRDGVSADYAVVDSGRTFDIAGREGDSFLTLRLTLPANYEASI